MKTNNIEDNPNSYIRVAEEEGFQKVLEIPFECKRKKTAEKYFIFFHKEDGILLAFDTFGGRINSAKMHYNIIPKDELLDQRVQARYHNCKSALGFKLKDLRENFQFLNRWVKVSNMVLSHYGETPMSYDFDFDYPQLTNQKILELPDFVREAITPTMQNLFADVPAIERSDVQSELLEQLRVDGFVSRLTWVNPETKTTVEIHDFHIFKYWTEHASIGRDYCKGRSSLIKESSRDGVVVSSKKDETTTQTVEFSLLNVVSFEK